MGTVLLVMLFFYLAIVVLMIAAHWKVYTKADKPGWACIIPIYSAIVHLEIIRKPTWWVFMLLIPFVNIYFAIVMLNELSKAFGKSTGFTVGMIFLPFIFFPILGFGDAQYVYNQTNEMNDLGMPQE